MDERGNIYADREDRVPERDKERLEKYFQDAIPEGVLAAEGSLSASDVEQVRAAFVARHRCS